MVAAIIDGWLVPWFFHVKRTACMKNRCQVEKSLWALNDVAGDTDQEGNALRQEYWWPVSKSCERFKSWTFMSGRSQLFHGE